VAFGMSDNALKPVDNRLAGHIAFHPKDSSEPHRAALEARVPRQDPKAPATRYLGGWFVDLGHPDDGEKS
jgi:uronate dehydrogenase